jgi:hypothetical protein
MIVYYDKDLKQKRNKEIVKLWNKLKKEGWLNKNIIMLLTEKFKIKERAIYYILKNTAK